MASSLSFAGLTIPSAAALNAVAQQRTLSVAGDRAVIPLTYGQARVAGLVLNVLQSSTDATKVLVQVLWGYACHAVSDVRLNNAALPAGSSVTTYTGAQTSADSALVAAFLAQGLAYTDTLHGFAYSVLALPIAQFTGELNASADVQGRELYDPRKDSTAGGSGSHRLADAATWEWSDNPSLALADWLASGVYGAGEPVLWSSVPAAADANDAMVGTPAEKHRLIGLSLISSAACPDVAETLRAYAGCWLVPTEGGMRLLPDANSPVSASYSHASGQIAAIGALSLRDSGNSPTVVEIVFTDATAVPPREGSAVAMEPDAGVSIPWRLSTVRMPGIQRYSQAYREAVERLNKLFLADLSTTLDVFDAGIAHEVGDIVTVTHPVGITSKLFRVTQPAMLEHGRWRLTLGEHDPAAYSTEVQTQPVYSNAGTVIGSATLGWGSVSGRPKTYRVISRGYLDTAGAALPSPTLWDAETMTNLSTVSFDRSYMLCRIRRSDGVVTFSRQYDVYGVGATGGYTAAHLAADLNATGSDSIAVVWTYDEPQSHRMDGALPAAMYRCGASRGVFGSPQFKSRSAYVLVGIGGCGEGNGFESYQGSVDSDTSAWCDVTFQLLNGALLVTGSGATPRTLADYSYSGDLAATRDLTLVATPGVVSLAGNTALKYSSDGAWTGQVYSQEAYAGGAFASAVALSDRPMFGLSASPSGVVSYTGIEFAIYSNGVATYKYESGAGTQIAASGAAVGDNLAVIYDGYWVRYMRNGVELSKTAAGSGRKFAFDASFYSIGDSIGSIRFGPLSAVAGIGTMQLGQAAATDVYRTTVNTDSYSYPHSTGSVKDRTFTPIEVVNATGHDIEVEVSSTGVRTYSTGTLTIGSASCTSWVSVANETDNQYVSTIQDWMPAQIPSIGANSSATYNESTAFSVTVPAGKTYSFASYTRSTAGMNSVASLTTRAYCLKVTVVKK